MTHIRNDEVRAKDAEIANRLNGKLTEKKVNRTKLAGELGIAMITFRKKLSGDSGITVGEFAKIAALSNFSVADIYYILGA